MKIAFEWNLNVKMANGCVSKTDDIQSIEHRVHNFWIISLVSSL